MVRETGVMPAGVRWLPGALVELHPVSREATMATANNRDAIRISNLFHVRGSATGHTLTGFGNEFAWLRPIQKPRALGGARKGAGRRSPAILS
jgi:hypothetical protein